MPVSNNTVLPLSGEASNARHASAMRFSASGAVQRAHNARGALPNIAPPSSFCELPRIDQSFMRPILMRRAVKQSLSRGGRVVGGEMEHERTALGLGGRDADRADLPARRQGALARGIGLAAQAQQTPAPALHHDLRSE